MKIKKTKSTIFFIKNSISTKIGSNMIIPKGDLFDKFISRSAPAKLFHASQAYNSVHPDMVITGNNIDTLSAGIKLSIVLY